MELWSLPIILLSETLVAYILLYAIGAIISAIGPIDGMNPFFFMSIIEFAVSDPFPRVIFSFILGMAGTGVTISATNN